MNDRKRAHPGECVKPEVERIDIALDPTLVRCARDELLDRISPARESGFRWGYLLGVESEVRSTLITATELDAKLRSEGLRPIETETGRSYELSFLKVANGKPPAAEEGVHFGGFHLDTHPKIKGESGIELARVLINLAPEPRQLKFALTDRFELARLGVRVHRGDYQVVALPVEIETAIVEIPGLQHDVAFGLRFWASVIPHVGVEGKAGHFLASYEAVAAYRGQRA